MKIILLLLYVILCINAQNIQNDKILNKSLWQTQKGKWEFRNNTLTQTSKDNYFALILLKDKQYSNIDINVNFKPISGKIDASGGLVFAATDENNYFIVRTNALENNFRLYIFKNAKRYQIADSIVQAPLLNKYYNIRIKVKNKTIYAYLNNKLHITCKLKNKIKGYVGLWTKADSVTAFKDLSIKVYK